METMQEMVDRVLEKIPKTKCKCGVIGSFKQIGECYNQYDDNNNPIMMDLIMCNSCDEIYSDSEYKKLEKIKPSVK